MSRNKTPSILWTKNLTRTEDKEQFLESLRLSGFVLERLKEILEEKQNEIMNNAISNKSFLNPSWSERQASLMGELRNIKFMINLLGV